MIERCARQHLALRCERADRRRRVLTFALTFVVIGCLALIGILYQTATGSLIDGEWKKAEQRFEADDTDQASELYENFLASHPRDSRARRARERLQEIEILRGLRAVEDGRLEDSAVHFRTAVDILPGGKHVFEARAHAVDIRERIERQATSTRLDSLLEQARLLTQQRGVRSGLDLVRRIDRSEYPTDLIERLEQLEDEFRQVLRTEVLASFVFTPTDGPSSPYPGDSLDRQNFGDGSIIALPLRDDRKRPALPGAEGFVHVQAKGILYGLDASSGEIVWTLRTGLGRHFELAHAGEDLVFVSAYRNTVARVGAADGKVRWECIVPDPVASSPLVEGGRIYVGTLANRLHVFDAQTGENQGQNQSHK